MNLAELAALTGAGAAAYTGRHALARQAKKTGRRASTEAWLWGRLTFRGARYRVSPALLRRLEKDRWAEMVVDRGLTGLKRGNMRRSAAGVDITVHLLRSMELGKLQGSISALETGLGVKRNSIRVEAHERADRAKVRIMTRDPLRTPHHWDAPHDAPSITHHIEMLTSPFGERGSIDPLQHILIAGRTGAGKSSVQRPLAAVAGLAPDAELMMFDLKGGAEAQHYKTLAARTFTNRVDSEAGIIWLAGECKRRSAVLSERGVSTWQPEAVDGERAIIAMIDEGADLIRGLSKKGLDALFTIAEQGRALRCFIWWATQYPIKANIPTQISSQMQCIIGLRMKTAQQSDVVFGAGSCSEGWTANRLKPKGYLYIRDEDHLDPELYRADWMDEKEMQPLVGAPGTVGLGMPQHADQAFSQIREEAPAAAAPRLHLVKEPKTPGDVIRHAMTRFPAGCSAAALIEATGLQKSRVYELLQQLTEAGEVESPRRGLYVLTRQPAQIGA